MRLIRVCLMAAMLMLVTQTSYAESGGGEDGPWERFSLKFGGFITDIKSDVRIDSELSERGTHIDVEDDLGLDSSLTVFRIDALYRFGESRRHRLDFSYFDFSRDATRVLSREVEIGDKVFPVDITVESFMDLQIFKGAYSYSLVLNDRMDVGVSAGLFIVPYETGIRAAALGLGGTDITAPLPVIGLHADFALTPKFFLKSNIDVFWFEIDKFKGSLVDATVALEYNVFEHVGFGVAAEALRFDLESDGEDYPRIDFIGSFNFDYTGLLLYGKVYF